jgi:hypothetical protein
MNELLADDILIADRQVPDLMTGRPVPFQRVRGWMDKGIKGAVLKSVRLAGRRCTTSRWYSQWLVEVDRQRALNGRGHGGP